MKGKSARSIAQIFLLITVLGFAGAIPFLLFGGEEWSMVLISWAAMCVALLAGCISALFAFRSDPRK